MKKIGIITHYCHSINYGGNLQAYALCKVLNNMGYDAEQISYEIVPEDNNGIKDIFLLIKKKNYRRFFYKIKKHILYCSNLLLFNDEMKSYKNALKMRRQAFQHFNRELIPNTDIIYTDKSINDVGNKYDVFITGSDQVWNFDQFREGYYLTFVPSDKTKLSYSASLAKNKLTQSQKSFLKSALKDFTSISVREKDAVELIQPFSNVKVNYTLDPTLLVDKEQWDELAANPLFDEKYIFCYFMGNNDISRSIAKQFANQENMKLVCIPMANDGFKFCDNTFADELINDASPEKFLSLIKYAEYVFTDSYHAVIFSNIFKKQYFVFDRDVNHSMNSRIIEITNLFKTKSRYFSESDKQTIDYVYSLENIDYSKHNEYLNDMISESIKYLNDAIDK